MNEYIDTLKDTSLFSGIEPQEIDGMLKCLSTMHVQYAKGGYIIEEGDKVYDFGIILSGHGRAIIAIQEIIKEYQRQKTNQRSRKGGSARKPQQYHAEAEVII